MTASACTHLCMWREGNLKLTETEKKEFFKGSKLPGNLKARFIYIYLNLLFKPFLSKCNGVFSIVGLSLEGVHIAPMVPGNIRANGSFDDLGTELVVPNGTACGLVLLPYLA